MNVISAEAGSVRLQLVAPPPDLAPYVSLYYRTDVARGAVVEDLVPPEWANLRVGNAPLYEAAIGADPLRRVPDVVLSGPTSRAARLRVGKGRFWGIGLLPLGFATFLRVPASDYANRLTDVATGPVAAPLRAMLEGLLHTAEPLETAAEAITQALRAQLAAPLPQAAEIQAAHAALLSDRAHTVASLAAELRVSTRTLERFCRRHFGFNPQLLLRRQRFLRSLGSFMVDPAMTWLNSLDSQYHDQAHFVRDFRCFMGMRPSDFAAMPHPMTMLAVQARRRARGEAMQVLHRPEPPIAA